MKLDDFWKIIDGIEPSSFDMEAKCVQLKKALQPLSPQDLRDFVDHYFALKNRAYCWPLWDAAIIMHGGCGDDSFMDFRSSLITFGKEVYQQALKNPDSLAKLSQPVPTDEDIFGVIHDAIEQKLGADYRPSSVEPDSPTGTSLEDDDESDYETLVDKRYPQLREQARQRASETMDLNSNRDWAWWLDVFTCGLYSKLNFRGKR